MHWKMIVVLRIPIFYFHLSTFEGFLLPTFSGIGAPAGWSEFCRPKGDNDFECSAP
jgi:hypothetical protein